ncbi:MAG: hypothetical protein QQM50_05560 [Dehalococcoides mccartyi]|uniref:Transcriptional regulator n=4 Tax=root TaxID=1 RepID=A0AB33HPB7_9CHLR|nr:hypothetical protein [Dehalococcoides mccartyi]MDP4280005.1 hypothetical protein [Dehalococcoides mccartyi]BAZ97143.1 hypothetical protein DEHALATV1_0515 [Dehalococcoides mccartyi]
MRVDIDKETKMELDEFLKQSAVDYTSRQIILLFSKHPFARFDRSAIASTIEGGSDILPTLQSLVSSGIIKLCQKGGAELYYLTSEPELREMVTRLGNMEWKQQQNFSRRKLIGLNVFPQTRPLGTH